MFTLYTIWSIWCILLYEVQLKSDTIQIIANRTTACRATTNRVKNPATTQTEPAETDTWAKHGQAAKELDSIKFDAAIDTPLDKPPPPEATTNRTSSPCRQGKTYFRVILKTNYIYCARQF